MEPFRLIAFVGQASRSSCMTKSTSTPLFFAPIAVCREVDVFCILSTQADDRVPWSLEVGLVAFGAWRRVRPPQHHLGIVTGVLEYFLTAIMVAVMHPHIVHMQFG